MVDWLEQFRQKRVERMKLIKQLENLTGPDYRDALAELTVRDALAELTGDTMWPDNAVLLHIAQDIRGIRDTLRSMNERDRLRYMREKGDG